MKSIVEYGNEVASRFIARKVSVAAAPSALRGVSDAAYAGFVAVMVALCALYVPNIAEAGTSSFAKTLCNALQLINDVGGPVATLAVIVIGLGALLGKVSWGMAVLICVGIATIFGASSIVDLIQGNATCA